MSFWSRLSDLIDQFYIVAHLLIVGIVAYRKCTSSPAQLEGDNISRSHKLPGYSMLTITCSLFLSNLLCIFTTVGCLLRSGRCGHPSPNRLFPKTIRQEGRHKVHHHPDSRFCSEMVHCSMPLRAGHALWCQGRDAV